MKIKMKLVFLFIAFITSLSACSVSKDISNRINLDATYFKIKDVQGIPQSYNLADAVEVCDKYEIPIISQGIQGTWDAVDVLNPSVVYFNGIMFNYYSGYDGESWRTGIATSQDGTQWEKYAHNPVLDIGTSDWDNTYIAANGSAVIINDEVYYYYQAKGNNITQIGLAISKDGFNFEKHDKPVLEIGEKGMWDEKAVADPYVIEVDNMYYMYYLGMNSEYVQKLGVAVSEDGLKWSKYTQNPILDVGTINDFDYNGLGEPSVIYKSPYFYMIYTGRSANEVRDLGVAISKDGVNYRKISNVGIFNNGVINQGAWNSHVVCDSSLIEVNDEIYMYYGGGDRPEPAQNLNGKIGFAKLELKYLWDQSEIDLQELLDKSIDLSDIMSGVHPSDSAETWAKSRISVELLKKSESIILQGWIPNSYPESNISQLKFDFYVNEALVSTQYFELGESFNVIVPITTVDFGSNYSLQVVTNYEYVPEEHGINDDIRILSYIFKGIYQE